MKKVLVFVVAAWVSIAAQSPAPGPGSGKKVEGAGPSAAGGPGLSTVEGPQFKIDPTWPKPLPAGWIIGRTGSVCADAHDHLIVTNRRDITDEEAETSKQAPSVLIFDPAGNLADSWGDSNTVPGTIHG